MSLFCVRPEVYAPGIREVSVKARPRLLAGTASDLSWVCSRTLQSLGIQPEKELQFTFPDGEQVIRQVGFAVVACGSVHTIDEIVFGQPGDLQLLGTRTLEGLRLAVDLNRRRLVRDDNVIAA
jgi:hypothetical protein